ncbi:MAG: dockerin type I repeat-containing protein [Clostridia bacterium]|nr:dockerin type I repeat-containing protein [Clostridia bacterium]
MKKILCVFLGIMMLTGLTLPVFAQEKDAVKIAMRAAHVSGTVLFIDKAAPDTHFLHLDVSFDKISDYEYIEVKISNNNDVLKFENAHVTDDAVTFKSIVGSGKEAYFIARFNRDYLGTEYQDKYCDGMISFSVEAEGKIELTATAYGIDLEGNRVDLDVEFENVITEIKSENNLELNFGSMFFKPDANDNNFMWIDLNLNGKYHNVDKFIIHFTADKNILGISNPYSGDVHLDYFVSWEETDIGYDQIISSYNVDDYSQIHYYTNFIKKQAGIHNLSATAEVIYKDGTTENIHVDMSGLEEKILDYSLISKGDVNCDGTVTASDARSALRISAGLDTPADDIRALADFDSNGKVTAADARKILRIAAGL